MLAFVHFLVMRVHDYLAEDEMVGTPGKLPWWFAYIGWAVTLLVMVTASFFTMLYGLRYGKQKSIDW